MVRTFVYRYKLFLLLFLVFISLAIIPWHNRTLPVPALSTAPGPAIIGQATSTSQGIQLTWLQAQAGAHIIGGYIIERRHQRAPFQRIGRVEKGSRAYLDTGGQTGDQYRIITEDNQRPANHSAPSETIIATAARPGDTVLLASASPPPSVLGSSTTDQTPAPDREAESLQGLLTKATGKLDEAANKQDVQAMGRSLDDIQRYQQHLLALFPHIAPYQKAHLASACSQHIHVIDSALRLLPEQYQLDGLLVRAGCSAMQGSAQ